MPLVRIALFNGNNVNFFVLIDCLEEIEKR
jgi:hypothetical protein